MLYLNVFHYSAGSRLGLSVEDQQVLSRQRRDEGRGKSRNGRKRGKKEDSDEDSNESKGSDNDGNNGDVGGNSGKLQNNRRKRMGEREGNVCFRNYEVRVMTENCRKITKVTKERGMCASETTKLG